MIKNGKLVKKVDHYGDLPAEWNKTTKNFHVLRKNKTVNIRQMEYTQRQSVEISLQGINYLRNNKDDIFLLKTDLWTEGVDTKREVLNKLLSKIKKQKVKSYGIDISSEVCNKAKLNGTKAIISQSDISRLHFKKSFFDIIVDLSTIDHMPFNKAKKALGEYYRCLKPEGILVLMFAPSGGLFQFYRCCFGSRIFKFIFGKNGYDAFTADDVYTFSIKEMGSFLNFRGFKILKEYSLYFLNMPILSRITKRFPPLLPLFKKFEFTIFSKYFHFFSPMYVFIVKKVEKKTPLEQMKFWDWRSKISGDSFQSVLWLDRPEWNSYIDKLQMFYLDKYFNKLKKTDQVLDIGCGIGRISFRLAKLCGKLYGIDVSKNSIEICKSKAKKMKMVHNTFETGDARNIKFINKFNYIFSITVLENLTKRQDFEMAIKNLLRSTKHGGKIILLEHFTKNFNSENLFYVSKEEIFEIIKKFGGHINYWCGIDTPVLRNFVNNVFGYLTKFVTRKGFKCSGDIFYDQKILADYLSKQNLFLRWVEKIIMYVLTRLLLPFECILPKIFKGQSEYILIEIEKKKI